jgi:hypothetical protein
MSLLQDLRLAFRRMQRSPMFAMSVAGTLAVGIAATTSIYSVVDGVLLKPLPFRDAGALVRVTADYSALGLPDVGMSQPELEDYAARSSASRSCWRARTTSSCWGPSRHSDERSTRGTKCLASRRWP